MSKNEKVADLGCYTILFRRLIWGAGILLAATIAAIAIVLFL